MSPRSALPEPLPARRPGPHRHGHLPESGHPLRRDDQKYIAQGRDLGELTAIPLVIANWMRYLLAVDDEASPSARIGPAACRVANHLDDVVLGQGVDARTALQPILSNSAIFGVNLYETPLATRVEELFHPTRGRPWRRP